MGPSPWLLCFLVLCVDRALADFKERASHQVQEVPLEALE